RPGRWTGPMAYRLLLSALLLVGVLGGSPERRTLARFSTAATSRQNQFSAGTLHIAANLAVGNTLSISNLIPGDNFDAELIVASSGTIPLVYSMTTTTTGSVA